MRPDARSAHVTRADRAARGWIVAAFATVTAGISHGLAGGTFPGAFGIVASLVLAGAASSLLASRRQSPLRLAAAVAVTQVMYHAIFSGMGDPSTPVPAGITSHDHAAALPEVLHTHGHSGGMWLAHVIAGLITLIVLLHADHAVWTIARVVRLFVARLLGVWVDVSPRFPARMPVAAERGIRRALLVLFSSMRYRGPPAARFAA
ncbi:hypothetical protein M2152_001429 [Microbacteriaceae bacterium SG_E_30_P1]|uniref:MFS transporter n=1 Tax=Antiquaquibacter oligotrophicus TaxID=2880260 RepID=A0ABT6KPZ2_9MICO|nr:hypothetical protein [Antiquaquibacter oligotrophicus]MDH6181247.1 hypothetical protein [Antiquaquibacter oligotrophicus]UDF13058.1 hypothetical protein LH407_12990 [Antiquaquibacter oligotrophicus]